MPFRKRRRWQPHKSFQLCLAIHDQAGLADGLAPCSVFLPSGMQLMLGCGSQAHFREDLASAGSSEMQPYILSLSIRGRDLDPGSPCALCVPACFQQLAL